jgi:hypothetical protein
MASYSKTVLLAIPLAVASSGCRVDPTIKPANQLPVADARVMRDGKSVDEVTDGADALKFDYSGTPVAITLDASHSYDPDGTIRTYRWLSGTVAPDGGIPLSDGTGVSRRWVPAGEPPDWPDDVMSPMVELDMGIWEFSLWVIDDGGATSMPDSIKITVGSVVDPVVQKCVDNVLPSEPEACRQCMCGQSDMCRAAVTQDACDQVCWDLINCVAAHCPDFVAMAMKMPPDYSCLVMNCMAFTAGAAAAQPAGACYRACPNDCMPVPTSMPGTTNP